MCAHGGVSPGARVDSVGNFALISAMFDDALMFALMSLNAK